jgi:3-hydroxy-3-methylglutaryl CoA synthase
MTHCATEQRLASQHDVDSTTDVNEFHTPFCRSAQRVRTAMCQRTLPCRVRGSEALTEREKVAPSLQVFRTLQKVSRKFRERFYTLA